MDAFDVVHEQQTSLLPANGPVSVGLQPVSGRAEIHVTLQ
jgi:hypothetical protein